MPSRDVRRSPEQIREHYEVEKELAHRLREANASERLLLYTALYDELLDRVPDHPMLTRPPEAAVSERQLSRQLSLLRPMLGAADAFLEVGAGNCRLSLALTPDIRRVYAVDVTEKLIKDIARPDNFELILSDGSSIPVPEGEVALAYSNQLMEHLHPADALTQLRQIYRALRPGGAYVCITPHRYSGPHDISKHFDRIATGFHLKEYTYRELATLFREVGFSRLRTILPVGKEYVSLPLTAATALENILAAIPSGARGPICRGRVVQALLGIRLVAWK